jgi:hypothetical protein
MGKKVTINNYPVALPFTIGALLRGTVRRYLQLHQMQYTEVKGWVDSQFMITFTSEDQGLAWNAFVRRLNAD